MVFNSRLSWARLEFACWKTFGIEFKKSGISTWFGPAFFVFRWVKPKARIVETGGSTKPRFLNVNACQCQCKCQCKVLGLLMNPGSFWVNESWVILMNPGSLFDPFWDWTDDSCIVDAGGSAKLRYFNSHRISRVSFQLLQCMYRAYCWIDKPTVFNSKKGERKEKKRKREQENKRQKEEKE